MSFLYEFHTYDFTVHVSCEVYAKYVYDNTDLHLLGVNKLKAQSVHKILLSFQSSVQRIYDLIGFPTSKFEVIIKPQK